MQHDGVAILLSAHSYFFASPSASLVLGFQPSVFSARVRLRSLRRTPTGLAGSYFGLIGLGVGIPRRLFSCLCSSHCPRSFTHFNPKSPHEPARTNTYSSEAWFGRWMSAVAILVTADVSFAKSEMRGMETPPCVWREAPPPSKAPRTCM